MGKATQRCLRFAVALGLLAPALAWAAQAGVIELLEGEVQITSKSGEAMVTRVAQAVNEGDTIATGKTGEVHFRMEDQALVAVRPNTRMRIDVYRAFGNSDDQSALFLLKGTFRAVTGWIGRYNKERYAIKTPTATIGIRGTDHEPAHFGPETTPGERENHAPGSYDKVNLGETFMQNAAGKISVTRDRAGFAPSEAGGAPQLLARAPAFYRRTRNEPTFESKHAQQAKEIETKRIEKIERMKKDAAGGGASKAGEESGAQKKAGTHKRAIQKRENK